MAEIAVVGDGPGGLSAALFLAKAGHTTHVYGLDNTAMHYAYLYNYLGIPEMSGTEFQQLARAQVLDKGAELHAVEVTTVEQDGDGFVVVAGDDRVRVDYLILSEGKNAPIGEALGVTTDDGAITTDTNGRTSLTRVYAVGRSVRPTRSQAIISAGQGAAAALDILSEITGSDVQDWDSPPRS